MSESQTYFLRGLGEACRFGAASLGALKQSLVDLREKLAVIHDPLPDVDYIRYPPRKDKGDLADRCILMRATVEPNPGIPIMTARWDFTSTPPQASIRIMIYYPGDGLKRWGFRWDLPGGNSGVKHDFTHVQPIRELRIGSDNAPSPDVLSENVPTFMVSRRRDRPDLLLAHALLALYGEDPDLLALLRSLPNGDRVLQDLG